MRCVVEKPRMLWGGRSHWVMAAMVVFSVVACSAFVHHRTAAETERIERFLEKLGHVESPHLVRAPEGMNFAEIMEFARGNTPDGLSFWGIVPLDDHDFIVYEGGVD